MDRTFGARGWRIGAWPSTGAWIDAGIGAGIGAGIWIGAAMLVAAPLPVRANCNLIPQVVAEIPSASGTVDRTVALPGDTVTVRTNLACAPFGPAFARDPAAQRVELRFQPPGGGAETALEIGAGVEVANCGTDTAGRCDTLRFPIPDTDALLPPSGDGIGLAGPASIRISERATGAALAEIGPLFEPARACADRVPEAVFGHFVVLPPANPFVALEQGTRALATLDGGGNLLVPIDFRGVIGGDPALPLFRLLSANALVPAFSGSPDPIRIPDARFVRSFTTRGRPIPPILGANLEQTGVFGSADAPLSVLRIARFDPDAPGAPAGGLYDLSDRFFAGRGAIVIDDVSAERQSVARLGDLTTGGDLAVSGPDETLGDLDLDGDGDALDRVPAVIALRAGEAPSTGQGAAELSPGPLARLALATDGARVAVLTSERRHANEASPADENGDGDPFDSLLRIFTLAGDALTELTAGRAEPIEAEPRIDGHPLAISDTRIFFRARESDAAARTTGSASDRAGSESSGAELARSGGSNRPLSGDGRLLAFASRSSNYVAKDTNGLRDVFVVDRTAGTIRRISDPPGPAQADGESHSPALSADGRWLAFVSRARNLVDGFAPAREAIYVADLASGAITPITIGTGGGACGGSSASPNLSADGRFVVFESSANDLVPGDRDDLADVFLHDRDADADGVFDEPGAVRVQRISVAPDGSPADGPSSQPDVSADGRRISFLSLAKNLRAGAPLSGAAQAWVYDRDAGALLLASADEAGNPATSDASAARLSADGRFAAFATAAALLSDDANGAGDVYVRDLERGSSERASLTPSGGEDGAASGSPSLSGDGRFVAFATGSTRLFPAGGGAPRILVWDRLTDTNELASVSEAGQPADAAAVDPRIAADGRTVAFVSAATNLLPDANGVADVFVRSFRDETSYNADADARDTVLRVFDPEHGLASLLAVGAVSVSGGRALALVPEADEGDVDLDLDGDRRDEVVHWFEPHADGSVEVRNLGLAGRAVSLSEQSACLTVSEADQAGTDRNGDGDTNDAVLHVGSAAGVPAVLDTGVAARQIAALGSYCVAQVPEADQAGAPLAIANADGDADDDVLAVTGADGSLVYPQSPSMAARDFAVEREGRLVAFRACEADEAVTVLNDDGDSDDCVMQVLDLGAAGGPERIDTGYAAIRCEFEACAFFFEPYRVRGETVSFAALEADQSGPTTGRRADGSVGGVGCSRTSAPGECDLTGDGDAVDTVIVVYNVRTRSAQIYELGGSGPARSVEPFPFQQAADTVLRLETSEAALGSDCTGDGDLGDPCLLLVGDSDGDGVFDDSIGAPDNAREVPNPDQADVDGDGLGDVIDPDPETPSLGACDLDGNGTIDRSDVERVFADRGMAARSDDPRDPTGDGRVSVADSALCSERCTNPDCAPGAPLPAPPPGSCGLGAELALVLSGWWAWRSRRRREERA